MIVAGDFNAHTGASVQRRNEDAARPLNEMGKWILGMEEAIAEISIANGRVPGDTCGNFTFWNSRNQKSTPDYILLDQDLLSKASLEIQGPPPHERLDHCPLRLSLQGYDQVRPTPTTTSTNSIPQVTKSRTTSPFYKNIRSYFWRRRQRQKEQRTAAAWRRRWRRLLEPSRRASKQLGPRKWPLEASA